jgi:hypothetical protein
MQVYLLECLARQSVEAGEPAEILLTRVASRLQHANSAVVLAAVKVVLSHLDAVTNTERRDEFLRKLAAPLVTLLSQRSEVRSRVCARVTQRARLHIASASSAELRRQPLSRLLRCAWRSPSCRGHASSVGRSTGRLLRCVCELQETRSTLCRCSMWLCATST